MKINNIYLCEDDKAQATYIERLIKTASIIESDEQNTYKLVFTSNSYTEMMNHIQNNDITRGIYFLDIELGDKSNGIDLADEVKQRDLAAQIIFITSHSEMAVTTFERQIGALDYIMKTDSEESLQKRITNDLRRASQKIRELETTEERMFTYQVGSSFYRIPKSSIYYFSTTLFPHRLKIVSAGEIAEFTGDIKNIEARLDGFIKASQSYLVNPVNIKEINSKSRVILLNNGDEIKYSFSAVRRINKLKKELKK